MNTSRTLDAMMNPQPVSIHRAILSRLVPLWLLLSLALGGMSYWIESQRVSRFVLEVSLKATAHFEHNMPDSLRQSPGIELKSQLDGLLHQTPFVGIRLYGANGQMLSQSWRQTGLSAQIPPYPISPAPRRDDGAALTAAPDIVPRPLPLLPERYQHQVRQIDDRFFVQSLLPLRDAYGSLHGYMEGVYQVDAQTTQAIGSRIGDTLLVVLLVIALASGALYPLVLALNRDSVRLSHHLLASNIELMRVLGSAIAKRDSDTDSHNYRVTLYAVELAQAMQRPPREILALMAGAFLHDVGKIGISDTILLKPGKLDAEEFAVMKTHVAIGLEIIGEVKWLELAQDVIGCHHERYDGSGYPNGLAGDRIPFNARLFAIVDVFDALTSARPYKPAFSFKRAMTMMQDEVGSHFDPQIFACFQAQAARWHARYNLADTATLQRRLTEIAVSRYLHQDAHALK